ncbi:TPA: hypothetical protein ACLZWE_001622 [Streptococcus pneumoniae]
MNYFRKRRERQAKSNSGIYCPAANRSKIQYETKEKADHAVQYDNGGLVRSYYCRTCACWHTTSKSNKPPLEVSIIFKNFLPNPDLPICQLFCLFC